MLPLLCIQLIAIGFEIVITSVATSVEAEVLPQRTKCQGLPNLGTQ